MVFIIFFLDNDDNNEYAALIILFSLKNYQGYHQYIKMDNFHNLFIHKNNIWNNAFKFLHEKFSIT